MKTTSIMLNITSEDPQRFLAFYRDVIGLSPNPGMGEFALDTVPGATIAFDGHSEITGPAREPARHLVNLFVEDVAAEEARLKAQGVKFIREQGVEWWGGVISTCTDPDGNYLQIIQYDPSRATANPDEVAAPA